MTQYHLKAYWNKLPGFPAQDIGEIFFVIGG
jgi:hypothetical protein